MNILFLFVSLPNLSNHNALYSSLIHEFKKNGHKILVSSRGSEDLKESSVVEEEGIRVLRVKSKPFVGISNPVKKALAYQEYTYKQLRLIKKYFGSESIDLVISHSLPPEIAWTISGIKKHFKCKFLLIQSDFIWQDAVAYGMIKKNGVIAHYYQFWEKRMFELADYIACPSKGNIDFIKNLYVWTKDKNIFVLPWWQGPLNFESNINIKEELGLSNKFVVIYGGSIGKPQRLEHLIDLAISCRDFDDIVFLILGKGAYLDNIKNYAKNNRAKNILFQSFLPQPQYLSLLATCDVGVIILNELNATPNIPSKTMSYLSLKVPILAAIDRVTDYGNLLEENEMGLWSYSGDIESFRNNLLKYYKSKDLCNAVRNNGYKYYIEQMLPEKAYNKIIEEIT